MKERISNDEKRKAVNFKISFRIKTAANFKNMKITYHLCMDDHILVHILNRSYQLSIVDDTNIDLVLCKYHLYNL